jgi:hypothetical protein
VRKAINNNPVVQIGLLGVLGLLVAVVFMSRMGGGSEAPPAAEETATTGTAAPATTAATPASPTAPAAPAAPDAAAPTAPAPIAASTPFEASKGLPADLVDAYDSGDVVVLLVMQKKGFEDEAVLKDVESLEGRGDTSIFITDTKNVSDYSRIAEGVTLDRVPAIIVLQPLDGKAPEGSAAPMPNATVSYGYRGKESIVTAIEDARYNGKQLSYDPG